MGGTLQQALGGVAILYSTSPHPMAVLDESGMIVWSNNAARRDLGAAAGTRWRATSTDAAWADTADAHFRVACNDVVVDGQTLRTVTLFETADLHDRLRELDEHAGTDPFTGLANRRRLIEVAARWRSAAVGLLFVDLDRFKAVNDTHGHQVGNQALMVLASRLQAAVRHEDLVVRWGGDEFVVLSRAPRSVWHLSERIREAINEPIQVGDLTLDVSASIGLCAGLPGWDLDHLVTQADLSMFEDKGIRSASEPAPEPVIDLINDDPEWRPVFAQRKRYT